jgi:hypothetical protein
MKDALRFRPISRREERPVTPNAPPPIAPLLAAVRDLLAQRVNWLQVRQARAAQDALLADLAALRQKAERRLADLKTRGRPASAPAPAPIAPPADWEPPTPIAAPAPRAAPAPQPRRPSLNQNRAQLSEWANRFQRFIAVEAGVLMRINQIVEDGDRPLGEAVVLLPDKAFEPLRNEPAEEYAARLAAWMEALEECRRRLDNEVSRDEVNLRPWLGVRDLWQERETDKGRDAWDGYLDRCRAELGAEIEKLQADADRLEGLER